MDADKLIVEARNSISSFCINECNAYCCRKGYLTLSDSEMKLIVGDLEEELIEKDILKSVKDGEWALFLGTPGLPCPRLKDSKCTIHDNPGRPSTCDQFPLFVLEGKNLRLSNRCLAVKQMKLYPYVKQLREMGYTFVHSPDVVYL